MSSPTPSRNTAKTPSVLKLSRKVFFGLMAASFVIGSGVSAGVVAGVSYIRNSPERVLARAFKTCQDENSSDEKLTPAAYGAIEYEQSFNAENTPIFDCIISEVKMPESVSTAVSIAYENADQKDTSTWDGLKATWVYYTTKNKLQTDLLIEVAR